jgi:DNA-binding CsgD family transcriptional regulator
MLNLSGGIEKAPDRDKKYWPPIPYVQHENDQLRVLSSALRKSVDSAGLIWVHGAPGAGKTVALRAAARSIESEGDLVLAAVATPADRACPFGVVERIFAQLPQEAGSPYDFSALRKTAPAAGPAYLENLGKLFSASLPYLEGRRSAVLVDNFQYMDGDSARILLYLLQRLRRSPFLMVLSESPTATPRDPKIRAEFDKEPDCHSVTLGLLDAAQVEQLAATRIGAREAAGIAADLHRLSGGNPQLVTALLADRVAGEPVLPGRVFTAAVSSWLDQADPDVVAGFHNVVVLGGPLPNHIAGTVCTETPATEHARLFMRETGLAPSGGLPPETRASLLAELPPGRRVELHLEAARLLYYDSGESEELLTHLVEAGRAPDGTMFPLLWSAADRELQAGDEAAAVAWLQLALRSPISDRHRTRTLTALASIAWRNNPRSAGKYLDYLVSAAALGHSDAGDVATTVKYLLWHGRAQDAEATIRNWWQTIEETDSSSVVQLQVILRWLHFSDLALYNRLRDVQAAAQSVGATAVPGRMAQQALFRVLTEDTDDSPVNDAEQVLRYTHLEQVSLNSVVEPQLAAIFALVYKDRLDQAAQRCDALIAQIESLHTNTWTAVLSCLRALIALRQGEAETALVHARSAVRVLPPADWGGRIGFPLSVLVQALSAQGLHTEAAEYLNIPVADATFDSLFGLWYLHARGTAALATHRWEAALGDFENCGRLMAEWGNDRPVIIPWRTGAAEARLRMGDPESARALIREQLRLPTGEYPTARVPSLRLLAATLGPEERIPVLTEAAQLLEELADTKTLSRVLTDLGEAHRSLGETAQGRTLIRRAQGLTGGRAQGLSGVQSHGHDPDARASYPGVAPAAVAGFASKQNSLSEAERRVAALTAAGHTNREVADVLFLAVSTVEQHLTRIYRKLRIGGRRDLIDLLHSDSSRSGPWSVGS